MADSLASGGRKNFIIIILKEKLKPNDIPKQFRKYLMLKNIYIDGTKNTDQLQDKLRLNDVVLFLLSSLGLSCKNNYALSII